MVWGVYGRQPIHASCLLFLPVSLKSIFFLFKQGDIREENKERDLGLGVKEIQGQSLQYPHTLSSFFSLYIVPH